MEKLTDNQIVRLHWMHYDGMLIGEIAKLLDVHRNSIRDHLRFRVTYRASVYRRLPTRPPPLPSAFPMPLNAIAPLLPGWPSRDVVYQMVARGVIEWQASVAIVPSRDGLVEKHCRCCTQEQLQRAAQRILPPGVWFAANTIAALRGEPPRAGYRGWTPADQISITVPAPLVHRALHTLELTGVAGV